MTTAKRQDMIRQFIRNAQREYRRGAVVLAKQAEDNIRDLAPRSSWKKLLREARS